MEQINEGEKRIKQFEELEQEISTLKQSLLSELNKRKSIELNLQERLKELNCHNQIAELMSDSAFPIDEVCEKILQIIPPSWQFPEITEASIQIYEKEFKTPNFEKTANSLQQEIISNHQIIGYIEVCYPDNKTGSDEKAFLPEEAKLLFSIAVKLGIYIGKAEKEIALRRSEAKYKDLIENISDVIYTIDNQAKITFISPSITRLLGYLPEEVIGKNFLDYVGESREQLQKRFEEIQKSIEIQDEYQILSASAEPHWIRFSSKAIYKEGQFVGVSGTLIDITERKLAKESILRANRLYAVISHVNQAIVYIRDKDKLLDEICSIAIDFGKFRMAWIGLLDEESKTVKPAVIKGWEDGYLSHIKQISLSDSPEGHGPTGNALREGTYFVCNDIENDPHMAPWRKEALKRGYRSSIALPIKQSGKVIASFNLYSNVPHFFNHEEIMLLEEVAGDISFAFDAIEVEKEREKAVQEVSKFRTITDQANYGSAITTLDGVLIYVNQEFARMHQCEPDELIGKNLNIFHNPEQKPRVEEAIELLKLYGKFSAEEIWRTRKDGSVFPSLMNASVIVDSNNIPQFLSATAIDITDLMQKEEALRQSEGDLNYAQQIANMSSWEHNLVTNQFTCSKNYYRQLGLQPGENEEKLYDYFISVVHPDDLKVVEYLQTTNYSENKLEVVELRIVLPNGTTRWWQNNVVPVFENGKLVSLKGVNIDITEKKLAEVEIRQQNERLNAIINAVPDLMFVIDKYGTFQEYYASHSQKLLVPEDLIIGSNVKILFDAETADLHIRKINECIEQQNLTTYEYVICNESTLWFFEARLAPLGEDRVLSFIRDITEKKQKDIQIRKLSLAVEQSPVIVAVTDLNGSIEYVNKAFTTVTGYSKEEAIGKNPRILQPEQTEKALYQNLWNTITTGKEWQGEWITRKKNGDQYWESASFTPIHDESGKITNYLAIKQDITQRKKDEQEIIREKERAEASDRLKTAFMNNISHEIRTPLNGILGFSQIISDPTSSDLEKEGYLRMLNESSDRLLNTVTNIMDISLLASSNQKLNKKEVILSDLFGRMNEKFKISCQQKKNTISMPEKTKQSILTDENLLTKILHQLIDNAVKFTSHGTITIGHKKHKNEYHFFVKDTGIGISEEYKSRIFGNFEQEDFATTRKYEGTGIGLSIAKGFIELLGGKMWMESEKGKGSTFYFSIPIA
ncbi:MAG: PAS domain S-box protein [Bacteroidia bacterium]